MTVVASAFARRDNDLYETEEWATEVLLRHFPVRGLRVWEPAAGDHKMVRVLDKHGAVVTASDIVVYTSAHPVHDFLSGAVFGDLPFDAIITNPPYGKGNRDAVRFAENALRHCDGMVALLLTAKFDFGKTRRHLFQDNPRFMAKIALLDRISWAGNGETGTEDHAWYVWGPSSYANAVMLYGGKEA